MKVTLYFDDTEHEAASNTGEGYIFRNGPAAVFVAELTAAMACHYGDQSIVSGPGVDEEADLIAATVVEERGD